MTQVVRLNIYVNFLSHEGDERVRAREDCAGLVPSRTRRPEDRFFRLNQNIKPKAAHRPQQ